MTRREELLLCLDKYRRARRKAADEAHENRQLEEAAERDLRELQNEEIKVLRDSGATVGLAELAEKYEAEEQSRA